MLLAALSLAFVLALELVHLPAALLIGTMIAAIFLAAREATIRIGSLPFLAAQGLIGCMVGANIPRSRYSASWWSTGCCSCSAWQP